MKKALNAMDVQRVRNVLPAGRVKTSKEVIEALRSGESGISRALAFHAVQLAKVEGLMLPIGRREDRLFYLNEHWEPLRPLRNKKAYAEKVPKQVTAQPVWAAMRPAPLVASLGVGAPDPEVMPPDVHAMISGLFRRIFEHDMGVE